MLNKSCFEQTDYENVEIFVIKTIFTTKISYIKIYEIQ